MLDVKCQKQKWDNFDLTYDNANSTLNNLYFNIQNMSGITLKPGQEAQVSAEVVSALISTQEISELCDGTGTSSTPADLVEQLRKFTEEQLKGINEEMGLADYLRTLISAEISPTG